MAIWIAVPLKKAPLGAIFVWQSFGLQGGRGTGHFLGTDSALFSGNVYSFC